MDNWTTLAVYALVIWVGLSFVALLVWWRVYLGERSYRRRAGQPQGFTILMVAVGLTLIFASQAWLAFLTVRRLLDFDPLGWTTTVTVPLLLLTLSIPIMAAAVLLWQRYHQ